jgi:ribonuclease Z
VLGRKAPLQVVGPPGAAAMVRNLRAAYAEDIRVRLEGLEPANDTGHRARVKEGQPGVVFRNADLTVHAFRARHGAWKHAWGYRFVTPDLDVCISGDTAPYPEMTTHYARCDLLIHEVYSAVAWRQRPPVWRRYHAASHTSTVELGRVAAKVKPGLLVLHHLLWKQITPAGFLREIRAHYRGRVVYGRDLMVIGLSKDFVRAKTGPRRGTFRVLRLAH